MSTRSNRPKPCNWCSNKLAARSARKSSLPQEPGRALSGTRRSPTKIEPVRGQMVCLEAKPQLTRHVIYSPRVTLFHARTVASWPVHQRKCRFCKKVTAGGISSILSNAYEISPAVSHLPDRRFLGRPATACRMTVCQCWVLVVKLTGSFMQPDITGTESYWRPSPES